MLRIQTFDARRGGNVIYKALVHPLAAERIAALAQGICGPLAVFDPDGVAEALYALHPQMARPDAYFVQDVAALGASLDGVRAQPLVEMPRSLCRTVLIASFDAARITQRISMFLPAGARVVSLDEARLPERLLTARNYLDKLNFATNYAFFRESDGLSTRLTSANYWARYGATRVFLWCRLFDSAGAELATWDEELPSGEGGFSIDSREIRQRFGLGEFCGQLFVHAVGVAGHDVVKYALDVFSTAPGDSADLRMAVTHDANAWPSDRYAGLPAPRAEERVMLWVQNSHAAPIPAGAVTIARMGEENAVAACGAVAPFASVAVDVGALLPGVRWPSQFEIRSGRHVVRPRYEVRDGANLLMAHVNVERADLQPDAGIKSLSNLLGRGYILPFPVLPSGEFRSIVQPNPMAESQASLPLRLDVFAPDGTRVAARFLGNLPRRHDLALDLEQVGATEGHAELVYDFRDGGEADGWLHGLFRYEHKASGHVADTSFGAHIFNTAMTYRDEPQSYAGPPPGLSTRLFLKLGVEGRRSFAVLIYPASAQWHEFSSTELQLVGSDGAVIRTRPLRIACSGSAMVFPDCLFGAEALAAAGAGGYVIVGDTRCRLCAYLGVMDGRGGFSLDHMFGF